MKGISQGLRQMLMLLLAFLLAVAVVGCQGSSSSGGGTTPSGGANAAVGTWVGTASTRSGSMTLTFRADMTGTSTWINPTGIDRSFPYSIDGNNLTWSQPPNDPVDCGGTSQMIDVVATISGSTMTGSFTAPASGTCPAGSGSFTATKQ